jgi:hypothetical protein
MGRRMTTFGRGATKAAGGGRVFTVVVYAIQFFFGGWFLVHGLNHWLEFFPRPLRIVSDLA